METARFDYELPQHLIAQEAVEPRDLSRLLVLRRSGGPIEHRCFRDIVDYLRPGDLLVVNDSRVMKARLFARRIPQGGRVQVLLLERIGTGPAGVGERWRVLVQPGRRAPVGQRLEMAGGALVARVVERTGEGGRILDLESPGAPEAVRTLLDESGMMPLPPYIRRPLRDPERYQTVYAREEGSAAAPTAGLHFTPELLDRVRERGGRIEAVTLHVGVGTFRPVRAARVEEHVMHEEGYTIPERTAEAIARTKSSGGRVWAVGTTVVRTLESAARSASGGDRAGAVLAGAGSTSLFIHPPFEFGVVDVLITNFHLPRSTLLMLVCAFGGTERVLAAYREAVAAGYRFYSLGDAMLVLP